MAATYVVGQTAGGAIITVRTFGSAGSAGDLGVQTNSSGSTGSAVPTLATFGGMNVSGNLVGFTGTGTSLNVNLTNTAAVKTQLYSATPAVTQVSSSATNVTLIAANTSRLGLAIFNDSTQILYAKFGATASTTSYTVQVAAGGYYEDPFGYSGRIDGIWASANGNAYVTELT